MRKNTGSPIDKDRSYDIPWDWLGGSEVKFVINDLEAKAERGITTGVLYRVRQAEIPSATLKFHKALTQSELYPIDDNTNKITYEPFDLTVTAYGGI